MKTQKLLLIIGALGVIFSIVGIVNKQEISKDIIGLVCGASLIYGYFELKNKTHES